MTSPEALQALNQRIINCRLCPRLVAHREEIALLRRRAYRDQIYWGRPLPGFGDPGARVLLVGLAPGAHGANRTGRMFTGDRSGEFLYRALCETGFANQPTSVTAQDGLVLKGAYITAAVRCVPPDNKPDRSEMDECRPYLAAELALLESVRVVVALGAIAMENYLRVLHSRGSIPSRAAFPFAHAAEYKTHPAGPTLLGSYHPSQQNTSTKRLTFPMLCAVLTRARVLAA